MKRLIWPCAVLVFAAILQSCAVYPYSPYVAYDGYSVYSGYQYGYQPYGYPLYDNFGWGRRYGWGGYYGWRPGGYGWGGHHGWGGGGYGWGGHHGWKGGHGRH